jgi:hypothetical protein
MEPESPTVTEDHVRFCPECGIEEPGFFCRKCGTLLRGESSVLCPRCRHIVENGTFCNQCGQELAGLALSLKQLDMAGDDFWVTGASSAPDAELEPAIAPLEEAVVLAEAELPDWLRQFPNEVPSQETKVHIVPSLEPLGAKKPGNTRGRFLTVAIVLMGFLLLGMMFFVIIALIQAGG